MVKLPAPEPVRKLRRGRIDEGIIESIAELVAKYGLTETESCMQLHLRPQEWFDFKGKNGNSAKYADILSRVRGARLKFICQSIDEAGEDYLQGKTLRRGDWRARAWLAENITARDRLQKAPESTSQTVNVNVALMLDTLKRLRSVQNVADDTKLLDIKTSNVKIPVQPPQAPAGEGY